jgi:hypothetical protein
MRLNHKQTLVFYPAYRKAIEVDAGIAPLLLALWDADIFTCNSCEENEPGIIWIEFYSTKDAEKLLLMIIKTLGDQIHNNPEANDWFCYRILGQNGDTLKPWRYDAHPNVFPARCNQKRIYSKSLESCKVELSVSLRFPKEDYSIVMGLLHRSQLKENENSTNTHDYMELLKLSRSNSSLKRKISTRQHSTNPIL